MEEIVRDETSSRMRDSSVRHYIEGNQRVPVRTCCVDIMAESAVHGFMKFLQTTIRMGVIRGGCNVLYPSNFTNIAKEIRGEITPTVCKQSRSRTVSCNYMDHVCFRT
jgi:hypothetical protein